MNSELEREALPSEEQIAEAFRNTNFGTEDVRAVLLKGVKSVALQYHNGFTLTNILRTLGLAKIGSNRNGADTLTELGLAYLISALSTEAQPEVTGAVVKFPESFVFVQEVIRHMSIWAEGKVMGSSRSPYDDCYPEKGDIRRVKRTAAFLLPRLKAAFDDLVEFCLLYEKRAPSPSAIEAAVRERLKTDGWINCSDRLPDYMPGRDESPVVFGVCNGKIGLYQRQFVGEGWLWAQANGYCAGDLEKTECEADDDYQVTHWHPMLSLPIGGHDAKG